MKRVFLSFHYKEDSTRVQLVKNIGAIDGQPLLSYNEWEAVKRQGDSAIKKWIGDQMDGRPCVVVLIGSDTANRRWINYEISTAWDSGKYLVGIYINKLKNIRGEQTPRGENPFKYVRLNNGKTLDQIVPTYIPSGSTSTEAYAWIKDNIEEVVEKAVKR